MVGVGPFHHGAGAGAVLHRDPAPPRPSRSVTSRLWELNEAFAAQVLACLAAWEDEKFCREVLRLDHPAGRIARDRLNVDGGAIGVGHPVGGKRQPHCVAPGQRDEAPRRQAGDCERNASAAGKGGAMLIEMV